MSEADTCPACGQARVRQHEVRSGPGWQCWLGNAEELLALVATKSVAGYVTDPPYGSGGDTRAARLRPAVQKYCSSNASYQRTMPEFDGDAIQPEAWTAMMRRVWDHAHRTLCVGGVVCVFSDWRQVPWTWKILRDAGVRIRGMVPWDKGASARPYRGGFRAQAEYVLWGGVGPLPRRDWYGPGVLRHTTLTNRKKHPVQKPLELMDDLVVAVAPGGLIVDPFMGSGTTGVAALAQGYTFLGIESTPHYFDVACARLAASGDPDA